MRQNVFFCAIFWSQTWTFSCSAAPSPPTPGPLDIPPKVALPFILGSTADMCFLFARTGEMGCEKWVQTPRNRKGKDMRYLQIHHGPPRAFQLRLSSAVGYRQNPRAVVCSCVFEFPGEAVCVSLFNGRTPGLSEPTRPANTPQRS